MEILVSSLEKRIGEKILFQDVNLHLKKGTSLALRGVNGSGKTTFLRILCGADRDFKGEVKFKSENPLKVGYVPQDIVLFDHFTVIDNLLVFMNERTKKRELIEKIHYFAEKFDFKYLLKKRVNTLSGGQKRLVNLMVCFIREPNIILLDEAFVGIDDEKLRLIKDYLIEIREKKIMILTSHQDVYLSEVTNVSVKLVKGKMEIENETN